MVTKAKERPVAAKKAATKRAAAPKVAAPAPQPNLTWQTLFDQPFQPGGGLWPVEDGATPVDYAYALDPNMAQHLVGAQDGRGKAIVLNQKLKRHVSIKLLTDPDAKPQKAWLDFAASPAQELIRAQLGLPLTPEQRTVVDAVLHGMDVKEGQWPSFVHPPKPIQRRGGYVQPNREGKRLIGAYIDIADIDRFKAIVQARGITVQEYFAQIVANEIAGAQNPAELEKLIDNQLDRIRATLRATLKR